MLSTTQRFEGPHLGGLLDEVHDKLGPEARVIAANRCRVGGIAGFFTKELFEVFVELDPKAPLVTDERVALAAGSRSERKSTISMPRKDLAETADPRLLALDQMIAAADLVEDLHADIDASHLDQPGRDAAIFANVLQRAVAAPPERLGVSCVGTTGLADTPSPGNTRRRDRGFSGLVERVIDLRSLESKTPPPRGRFRRAPRGLEAGKGVPKANWTPHAMFQPPVEIDLRYSPAKEALFELGVPESWLDAASDSPELIDEIVANIREPAILCARPGSALAVVGERQGALLTARSAASFLNTDANRCVLLSPDTQDRSTDFIHISNLDELEVWLDASGSPAVRVVAIDSGSGTNHAPWVRAALRQLQASPCWGVVDATCDPVEVSRWAASIGLLNAVAVTGLAKTCAPAALLKTGLEIARIDGHVASRQIWAKILTNRLDLVISEKLSMVNK